MITVIVAAQVNIVGQVRVGGWVLIRNKGVHVFNLSMFFKAGGYLGKLWSGPSHGLVLYRCTRCGGSVE